MRGTEVPDNVINAFNVHTADYAAMPQFGGSQAVLYESPDGRRVAGSFKESGTHTLTMAYDEFLFVIAGSAVITVDDGAPQRLGPGDALYLREKSAVRFEMSEDFHDVAVLISDREIAY